MGRAELSTSDLGALIGVIASLSGLVTAGRLPAEDVAYFERRMRRDGVITTSRPDPGLDVVAGLNRLNTSLRLALGESGNGSHDA